MYHNVVKNDVWHTTHGMLNKNYVNTTWMSFLAFEQLMLELILFYNLTCFTLLNITLSWRSSIHLTLIARQFLNVRKFYIVMLQLFVIGIKSNGNIIKGSWMESTIQSNFDGHLCIKICIYKHIVFQLQSFIWLLIYLAFLI